MARAIGKQSRPLDTWEHIITLGIQSRLDQIWMLRAALSGILDQLGMVEQDIYLLGIAVTEIANNSIEHGYAGADDKDVELCLRLKPGELQIEIWDHAPPFPSSLLERLQTKDLPLDDPSREWTMRGHGLQIVRQIADSFAIHSEDGRNCVTVRKHISVHDS